MQRSKNKPNKPVEKFFGFLILVAVFCFLYVQTALANPYGYDKYGDNKYGSDPMLQIATSGDVDIPITPGQLSRSIDPPNGASTSVSVICTSVQGFKLYIRSSTTTNLVNSAGGATILTTTNASNVWPTGGTLTDDNTWGYSLTDDNGFIGLTTTNQEILNYANYAYPTPVNTRLYFGVRAMADRPAGKYQSEVMFTAVAQFP